MKKWLPVAFCLACLLPSAAGTAAQSAPPRVPQSCDPPSAGYVIVCPDLQFQTMQGWGTSLAWWGNAMNPRDGWTPAIRNQLADLVFSPSKGLGFNVVRYNIGAGVMPTPPDASSGYFRQAANMPGFESANGHWNWNADPFQRAMLLAAKRRGANIFEAFSNSPPYWMTDVANSAGNCWLYDSADGVCNFPIPFAVENLEQANDWRFACYLTTVVQHFHDRWGVTFSTLEPLNEPSGSWWYPHASGNQEGANFSVSSQAQVIADIAMSLTAKSMTYVKVAASDENSVSVALQTLQSMASSDPQALAEIGQINTHGYSSDDLQSVSDRLSLQQLAARQQAGLWMSEYTTGGDTSIAGGLTLAEEIMRDLTYLRPTAWVYWQALDSGGGYGLLHVNDLLQGVAPQVTTQYWTMAQFSKFIRPGYRIIGITSPQFTSGATYPNTLAALSPNGRRLVIVAMNESNANQTLQFDVSRFRTLPIAVSSVYRTSASADLARSSGPAIGQGAFTDTLPPQSISTYVIDGVGQ